MKPSEALALHRDEVLKIIAKYPVSNPRVFGSVARGEDIEGSDLDIVIDSESRLTYFDLAKMEIELASLVGCKVDLGVFKSSKADIAPTVMRDMRPL